MSCALNRTIPNLQSGDNLALWRRMEIAKRRVLYTLARLDLMPRPKSAAHPGGLTFDILQPQPGEKVLTGHASGVITLNLLEANDAHREQQRNRFGEPYRTLVGHFRHETGHYFWQRFFEGSALASEWLAAFRQVFGDERVDYSQALARHHQNGPPGAWAAEYISAYATVHPWEDWAETWAQYLHAVDGLETARAFGWSGDQVRMPFTPFDAATIDALPPLAKDGGRAFLGSLNEWAKLAPALNEIAASLGQPDFYPFVLSPPSVRKICFVHAAASAAAAAPACQATESPA